MKLIELHIVQSFPVTCLNRDDVGAPKSAVFGGVQRARVSSQCWKRAIRLLAKEKAPDYFKGDRTKYVVSLLKEEFIKNELSEGKAQKAAEEIAKALGKKDDKKTDAGKTLVYLSPMEIEKAVSAYTVESDEKKKVGKAAKALEGSLKDKADIAIFGRMVADDHSLTLEGAGMFSHALSTHRVSNELDFFTAVDDKKPEDTEGAGHMGTNEFNCACYYRYIALNLDLLKDEHHLQCLKADESKMVVDAFVQACVEAVPGARKNSMMGYNLPCHALGFVREGQPLSLVNAFEKNLYATSGDAAQAMSAYWEQIKELYGLNGAVETVMPEHNYAEFRAELLKNV